MTSSAAMAASARPTSAAQLDALDALEDTVTDVLKQGAACIRALAADQLDAAELTTKAQQYLKLIDYVEGELVQQIRAITAAAAPMPYTVNAYLDEKALAVTANDVALARNLVRSCLDIATGAVSPPTDGSAGAGATGGTA